jgi:hypothetical protein
VEQLLKAGIKLLRDQNYCDPYKENNIRGEKFRGKK